MKVSDEAYLQGPIVPVVPRDPYAASAPYRPEQGASYQRERYYLDLMVAVPEWPSLPVPPSATDDPHQAPRVYAPAWERVRKPALPWDAEILAAGRTHTITAEAAQHPGDRSDPSEVR